MEALILLLLFAVLWTLWMIRDELRASRDVSEANKAEMQQIRLTIHALGRGTLPREFKRVK